MTRLYLDFMSVPPKNKKTKREKEKERNKNKIIHTNQHTFIKIYLHFFFAFSFYKLLSCALSTYLFSIKILFPLDVHMHIHT